jgi:RimJ/RimL family protein N-acetyltransferase
VTSHQIRDLSVSDIPWLFEACQDREIQFWTTIPRPYLMEHAQGYVNGDFPEYKIWVIVDEESRPVGLISIHEVDEGGVADLGLMVAPWGRGKGAGKNAIGLVEKYAQGDPKIKSLAACISNLNIASQKVAEAAGLIKSEVANRTCPAGDTQTSASMYRKNV